MRKMMIVLATATLLSACKEEKTASAPPPAPTPVAVPAPTPAPTPVVVEVAPKFDAVVCRNLPALLVALKSEWNPGGTSISGCEPVVRAGMKLDKQGEWYAGSARRTEVNIWKEQGGSERLVITSRADK